MSDEKDPVRGQIERDLEKAFNEEDIGSNGAYYAAISMAERQDPIAWDRCMDEVMKIVMDEDVLFKSNKAWLQMRDRIEKLRR